VHVKHDTDHNHYKNKDWFADDALPGYPRGTTLRSCKCYVQLAIGLCDNPLPLFLSVADQLCVDHSYCVLCVYTCVFDISLLSLCGFIYVMFLFIFILVSFYQKVGLSVGGGGVMGYAVE